MDVTQKLGKYGLVPVVVLEDANKALPTAQALKDGGLPVMEITLRTPAGLESIRRVHEAYPDYILGAGTVLTLEQCKEAVAAGASYIVSPGLNREIVLWCKEQGVAVVPGCVTPTEIETALSLGLKLLKFFPAGVCGGVDACKALYGPYASTGIRFLPTGGISPDNLDTYLGKPFIHAVGGGWLADSKLIQAENYAQITQNAKTAIAQMLGFEVAHVGINLESAEEANEVSDKFLAAFGFEKKVGNTSIFSSKGIEVLMSRGRGAMGHIAVKTNNVERAVFYLEQRGFRCDPNSLKYRNDVMFFAYLEEHIGGFAVHLILK